MVRVFLNHGRFDLRLGYFPSTGNMKHSDDDFSKFFHVSHFSVVNRNERIIHLKIAVRCKVMQLAYGESNINALLNFTIRDATEKLGAQNLLYAHVFPRSRAEGDKRYPLCTLGSLAALADLIFSHGGDIETLQAVAEQFQLKSEKSKLNILDSAELSESSLDEIRRALM